MYTEQYTESKAITIKIVGSFLSVVKTNFILLPIHSLIYFLFYVIHKVVVVHYFILCCSVGTQPKNLI